MNKYQIYYNVVSIGLFRSVHDSPVSNDFSELAGLIKMISREDDVISIYTTETKKRVQIWGDECPDRCLVEVNDALRGANFYKRVLKKWIEEITIKEFEGIVANPKSYGFECESF